MKITVTTTSQGLQIWIKLILSDTNFADLAVPTIWSTDFTFSLLYPHGDTVDRNGSLRPTYKKGFIDVVSIQSSTVDFV